MNQIADNIAKVRARVQHAAAQNHRNPEQIRIIAASKTRSPAMLRAALAAGIHDFGENYLQDALPKITELQGLPITWHFIGALQSNKCKAVAEHFDWFHCLERPAIAERLNRLRPDNFSPLNVCIQVNIDAEPSKAGVSVDEVPALIEAAAKHPQLRVRGLMAIPKARANTAEQEASYSALQHLLVECCQRFPELPLDTLSLGMSGDLETAIRFGSTMVRVGTDIFGPRS